MKNVKLSREEAALKMNNVVDVKEELSEIQIRHKLGEIDDNHAKVQLVACGLYMKALQLEQVFNAKKQ